MIFVLIISESLLGVGSILVGAADLGGVGISFKGEILACVVGSE